MLACVGCRYSETLQAAEVKKHVWTLTFGLAARLAYAAACVGDISMLHAGAPLTSPLLAPLNVLLQWMATQREIFRCILCLPCQNAAGSRLMLSQILIRWRWQCSFCCPISYAGEWIFWSCLIMSAFAIMQHIYTARLCQ